MLYRAIMIFTVFLYGFMFLSACGWLDPASDPVRIAQANDITSRTNIAIVQQQQAFAQQNAIAQAQADAIRAEAEAKADIARQTAFLWTVVDGLLIATLIICAAFVFTNMYNRRNPVNIPAHDPTPNPPGMINQVNLYVIRKDDGRWLITDCAGHRRYLNPASVADSRILSQIES